MIHLNYMLIFFGCWFALFIAVLSIIFTAPKPKIEKTIQFLPDQKEPSRFIKFLQNIASFPSSQFHFKKHIQETTISFEQARKRMLNKISMCASLPELRECDQIVVSYFHKLPRMERMNFLSEMEKAIRIKEQVILYGLDYVIPC